MSILLQSLVHSPNSIYPTPSVLHARSAFCVISNYCVHCIQKCIFVKLLTQVLCTVQHIVMAAESDLLRATSNKYFRRNSLLCCTLCLRLRATCIPAPSQFNSIISRTLSSFKFHVLSYIFSPLAENWKTIPTDNLLLFIFIFVLTFQQFVRQKSTVAQQS